LRYVIPGANTLQQPVNATVRAILRDGDTTVNASSIALKFDGATVTPTVTKAGTDTTVSFDPPGDLQFAKVYSVELSFSDSATPAKATTYSWSFTATVFGPGSLFIETEDFDFDSGKFFTTGPIGMTGQYPGGNYQDLGTEADNGIDWNNPGGNAGQPYRPTTMVAAGKPNAHPDGLPRGSFDVEVNHVVGWNDNGDWQNYTRDFPAAPTNYAVFVRGSSGGTPIDCTFYEVTAGVGTANQTLRELGVWRPGRATAGWDILEVFQVKDPSNVNNLVLTNWGGRKTLRWHTGPGNSDTDYLVFTPVAGTGGGTNQPPTGTNSFTSISVSGGNVVLSWTGSGTLQEAADITSPTPPTAWTAVPGVTGNTATIPIGANNRRFYRLLVSGP
jgi:hypothetical protein